MNNRRKFIIVFGATALAAPFGAFAQQQGKVWRIGVLSIGSASTARHLVEAFFKGMADLGYQEGHNVHYEVRYAIMNSASPGMGYWIRPEVTAPAAKKYTK
jgi:putative tryptophan/tyrosine transport system substrate-binding protein